jgi:hypothetical protein
MFFLHQNYPNPFNAQTTISYALPVDADVVLSVYTATGRHVLTLVDGFQRAGLRKELVDLASFASGAYFYSLRANESQGGTGRKYVDTKMLIHLK